MSMMDPLTSTGTIILHDTQQHDEPVASRRDGAKRGAVIALYTVLFIVAAPVTIPVSLVVAWLVRRAIRQDLVQLHQLT